jgi:hypothetical protein
VVRVTIRHAHCDQVGVEHLNLDAQFLQPPPVLKHRVGAHPMTCQNLMLPVDLGGSLGRLGTPHLLTGSSVSTFAHKELGSILFALHKAERPKYK